MAAEAKSGAQRAKDQARAAYMKEKGEYHGYRHSPWYQGMNYPLLTDVGSAEYRKAARR